MEIKRKKEKEIKIKRERRIGKGRGCVKKMKKFVGWMLKGTFF